MEKLGSSLLFDKELLFFGVDGSLYDKTVLLGVVLALAEGQSHIVEFVDDLDWCHKFRKSFNLHCLVAFFISVRYLLIKTKIKLVLFTKYSIFISFVKI